MKAFYFLWLVIAGSCSLLLPVSSCAKPESDSLLARPPLASSIPVTETVCGMSVTDPYRNLENLKDSSVLTWMKSQAGYARATLDRINGRIKFIENAKKWDEQKTFVFYQLKIAQNQSLFYTGINTGEMKPKLYYRLSATDKEVLLFNPETYENKNGKNWGIMEFYPSTDGKHVILTISSGGSETGFLLYINVATRSLLPEVITPVSRFAAWISNAVFTYHKINNDDIRDINRMKYQRSFIHHLGDAVPNDREVTASMYADLDIDSTEKAVVEHPDIRSAYIIGVVFSGEQNIRLYSTRDTSFRQGKPVFKELVTKEDKVWDYRVYKNTMFLITSKNASNYKVLQMELNNPDITQAKVIVPEFKDARITDVQVTDDALYISTLKNGVIAGLYRKEYGNKPVEQIELPLQSGGLELITSGGNSHEVWIRVSGWANLRKTFKYNSQKKKFTSLVLGPEQAYPEFDNLVVEEATIPSYDGTMVPVSLIYQKGLNKDGTHPLWMQGYGAYGRSEVPFFNPMMLSFTQFGGIIATVHVRGGGELGEAWRVAGYKTTKPNTWKDFIAAAEYMIHEKYTSAKKIGISGASAGGILIGRAMTERPDLFAVAISRVGAMNTLRFENTPNGPGSIAEFGTVKDTAECKALFEMDAYHHITKGTNYPATLITAGFNDPRVIAWQPAKFAAKLQAMNKDGKPVLFLTDYETGHFADNAFKRRINIIDDMSFILWQTGHPDFQPK